MKREKSCGAVLYRTKNAERLYLVIESVKGHTTLCKGHVEGAETEEETARREIFEETGLRVGAFEPGFRQTIRYSPKEGVDKEVVFFLGEAQSGSLRLQKEEVRAAGFQPIHQAVEACTFPSDREVLRAADSFLQEKGR